MKKSILPFLYLLLLSAITFAGTPPAEVQKAFEQKFAEATHIKWEKENKKEWEAEFVLGGTKVSANFLNDGSWVETETEISVSDLPVKVAASIKQKFTDCEVVSAFKIENVTHQTTYEADIKTGKSKKEVVLSEDGTFMK